MITRDNIRIGLDLDGVLADFMGSYIDKFGLPKRDEDITKNVSRVLRFDREFWINLPLLRKPDFNVTLYCTSRVNKKAWTRKFITNNGLPDSPIYQRWGYGMSKAPLIKGRIDVFIDDSVSNYVDLNRNGIPCLLMTTPENEWYETEHRVSSLNLDEIYRAYLKLMEWS